MAIKTNLKSMAPRREAFKRELVLMSKGAGNRLAWPGGKITVYPWDSSIDDLVLNGAKSGNPRNLLFEILEKVSSMNGKTDDFYADEINLVLLASRALANDGTIAYTSTCPAPGCGNKTQETIRVPDELEPVAEKADDWPGYDDIKLPKSGDYVRLRPVQIKDEKIIAQRLTPQRLAVPDSLLRILMHVELIGTDGKEWGKPETLEELHGWYNALPPKDAKFLAEQERALSPHANTVIAHKCDVCGTHFTHLLTFDTDFFR